MVLVARRRTRRIALVAPHGARVGGAEAHLLDLAESLAAGGDQVAVIHRTRGEDPVPGASSVYVSRGEDPGGVLADMGPDVVHVHDDGLEPGEADDVVRTTPVVRSLHNWWFGCSTGTLLRRGGRPCGRAHGPGCLGYIASASCTDRPNPLPAISRWRRLGAARENVRQAAAVITYSDYAQRIAIRNGVSADRCHVLRYYVDLPAVTTALPGAGRVCVVGRLTKLKGVDTLLQAVSLSRRVRELHVVGDGYYKEQLMARAGRLGISDRVEFAGWLDAAETRTAMRDADVVAVPSSWPEPFGIVGLEAMAVARPVLGARTGGITEWLQEGVTGCLAPAGDPMAWATALDSALEDPDTLTRWGVAGAEAVRGFSRKRHLEELERVYASLPAPPANR